MKKILILGAGRGQVGLIKAVKKLGYHSIVVSIEGDYPGFKIADEIVIEDVRNGEKIAEIAEKYDVDGICTAGTDMPLAALGVACEKNCLHGLNKETAKSSSNKMFMKDAFLEGNVSTAKYSKIFAKSDIDEALDKVGLPAIFKPVDLGGSRGINIIFDKSEAEAAYESTMLSTREEYCLLEEYIDGYEISATSAVANGKVLFVLPTADVRYGENDEIPVGHYVPLACDKDIYEQIKTEVEKSIKALDLEDCVVNADLMVKDGKVYILELTGRLGANAIPEITSAYYGFDIHELILEICVGNYENVEKYRKNYIEKMEQEEKESPMQKICFGQMIYSEKAGILAKDSLDAAGCDEWFFKGVGDPVNKFKNPGDCIGQIVTVGKSIEECQKRIEKALEKLEVE